MTAFSVIFKWKDTFVLVNICDNKCSDKEECKFFLKKHVHACYSGVFSWCRCKLWLSTEALPCCQSSGTVLQKACCPIHSYPEAGKVKAKSSFVWRFFTYFFYIILWVFCKEFQQHLCQSVNVLQLGVNGESQLFFCQSFMATFSQTCMFSCFYILKGWVLLVPAGVGRACMCLCLQSVAAQHSGLLYHCYISCLYTKIC